MSGMSVQGRCHRRSRGGTDDPGRGCPVARVGRWPRSARDGVAPGARRRRGCGAAAAARWRKRGRRQRGSAAARRRGSGGAAAVRPAFPAELNVGPPGPVHRTIDRGRDHSQGPDTTPDPEQDWKPWRYRAERPAPDTRIGRRRSVPVETMERRRRGGRVAGPRGRGAAAARGGAAAERRRGAGLRRAAAGPSHSSPSERAGRGILPLIISGVGAAGANIGSLAGVVTMSRASQPVERGRISSYTPPDGGDPLRPDDAAFEPAHDQ